MSEHTHIDMTLRTDNDNQDMRLCLSHDGGDEYWFTLVGRYERRPIQVDFEELTLTELQNIKATIDLVVEIKAMEAGQ